MLQLFHDMAKDFAQGKTEVTTAILGKYLNAAGFQDAARKAGINMKSPLANFLRVCP